MARSTALAVAGKGLVARMADKFAMTESAFMESVKKTIMPDKKVRGINGAKDTFVPASEAEVMAFLAVADAYQLNPFLRQIYAFASDKGGIVPIVPIDGWVKLVNGETRFAGVEFEDHVDSTSTIYAITCRMKILQPDAPNGYRTVETTEYLAECRRNTGPWDNWPRRMLRHKAYIQCGRIAFGFEGLVDDDEAERMAQSMAIDITPGPSAPRVLSNAASADPEPAKRTPPPPPPSSSGSAGGHSAGGSSAAGAADKKTDDEKRAYITEVSKRMAGVLGIAESEAVFDLSKFEPADKPGTFIGKQKAADIKGGRWLNTTYGNAKKFDEDNPVGRPVEADENGEVIDGEECPY